MGVKIRASYILKHASDLDETVDEIVYTNEYVFQEIDYQKQGALLCMTIIFSLRNQVMSDLEKNFEEDTKVPWIEFLAIGWKPTEESDEHPYLIVQEPSLQLQVTMFQQAFMEATRDE